MTHWEFYPSPYKDDDDVEPDDDVVIVNDQEKVPKEEFPEMVSGDKEGRSYKFATLTIIGQDMPIVLGIEPVREASAWEGDASQIENHSKADIVRRLLEQATQHVEISFMYVPSTEEDGKYAVFTTNRDVTPDQAMGLTAQYTWRWQIESEYKTIKHHFLPITASTDYRVRFLYFVLGVVMYNVWRLTNLLLREALSENLGAKPPLRAGEVVELIGFCLVPPD